MAEVNVLKWNWDTKTKKNKWFVGVGEETKLDIHIDEDTLRNLMFDLHQHQNCTRIEPVYKTPKRIKRALWNFRLSRVIGYLTGRYV